MSIYRIMSLFRIVRPEGASRAREEKTACVFTGTSINFMALISTAATIELSNDDTITLVYFE